MYSVGQRSVQLCPPSWTEESHTEAEEEGNKLEVINWPNFSIILSTLSADLWGGGAKGAGQYKGQKHKCVKYEQLELNYVELFLWTGLTFLLVQDCTNVHNNHWAVSAQHYFWLSQ